MKHHTEWIVERVLFLRNDQNGTCKEIILRVGKPYWTIPEHEAACPVEIEGLFESLRPIRGNDLWHALQSGISFVESYLRQTPLRQHLFWKNGEPYDVP